MANKYSNSKFITYIDRTANHGGYRTHKIDSVIIHCMGGDISVEFLGDMFHNLQASSNYGIDSDGNVAMYVDEMMRPWSASNIQVDNRAVSIQVASVRTNEPFDISEEAYDSLVILLQDICQRNSISSLKWLDDKDYGLKAALGQSVSKQNIFLHSWFQTDNTCPGQYIKSELRTIVKKVNSRLKLHKKVPDNTEDVVVGENSEPAPSEVYDGATVEIVKPQIDYTKLNPYLATVSRHTSSKLNYKKLKDNKIVGVLIEGGYLFDGSHRQVSSFRNPQCYDQVDACNRYELPFGYYMIARAKTIAEADSEMAQLAFLVRKYSPRLGVWLQLEFTTSKLKNNVLVEYYQKELERLGLKGRIGFYVTKKQLTTIDWSKFQDDWYLWIIDHVSATTQLDQLLTPEFFDMDGKG